MTTRRTTYPTPQATLTAAIMALDDIDLRHDVARVSFGQFSEHADVSGFFFSIVVNYSLGNTGRTMPTEQPDEEAARKIREGRVCKLTDAYAAYLAASSQSERVSGEPATEVTPR